MFKKYLHHVILLIGIVSLMSIIITTVYAEVDSETCTTTVQPEATTDPTTVPYSVSSTSVVINSVTSATVTYTAEYELEGAATVEDYGIVYAAARVYLRENPDYEWESIQDLMEVATIIQQCGETDGDFTLIQLLEDSVSMANDGVPDLSELGDLGWMYTYFFEPVPFEVTTSVSRTVEAVIEIEFVYDPPLEEWYNAASGTFTVVSNTSGTLGVMVSGTFVALDDITIDPEGSSLIFDISGVSGTFTVVYEPVTPVSGSEADLAIKTAISSDVDSFVFPPYVVSDTEGVEAVDEWKENVLSGNPDFADDADKYLNQDGELIDNTSEDLGGEEEGPLQFEADTNGKFDEGRTNDFDCPGQGNSCNHKSANAQNNGYVGNVNKFGCIGKGNSCNAKNGSSKDAAKAAKDSDSDAENQGNVTGKGKGKSKSNNGKAKGKK